MCCYLFYLAIFENCWNYRQYLGYDSHSNLDSSNFVQSFNIKIFALIVPIVKEAPSCLTRFLAGTGIWMGCAGNRERMITR